MNKWIKHGMTGLIISTAAFAAAKDSKLEFESAKEEVMSAVTIDALDLAGRSKLKDRMVVSNDDDMMMVYALLNT